VRRILPILLIPLFLSTTTFAETMHPAGLGSFGQGNGYSVTGNTGSAGYAIPIEVPEGHHGLTPRIALSYNSQSRGNGPYGFGWGLGIGTIVRSDSRGSSNDVYWSSLSENRYSLDLFGSGGELVLQDAQAKLFRTRQESFLRIQAESIPFSVEIV